MVCENCSNEHNGKYASGRFCSSKCARGFSTKDKRKEISEAVSKKLRGDEHPDVKKICEACFSEFISSWSQRGRKYCSTKCQYSIISEKQQIGPHRGKYSKNPRSIYELSSRTISKIVKRLKIGCSRCGWNEAKCDLHHIKGRKIDNADGHHNLTYLCPNCHRLFHSHIITEKDVVSFEKQVGERWKEYYYG